jgi:hypothetical protein
MRRFRTIDYAQKIPETPFIPRGEYRKVTLKGGQLTVALSKPEEKKLKDALEICTMLAKMQPVDVAITTEAEEGASSLKALLQICAKSEPTEEAPCEKDGQK